MKIDATPQDICTRAGRTKEKASAGPSGRDSCLTMGDTDRKFNGSRSRPYPLRSA
jgi:hypothetical protein